MRTRIALCGLAAIAAMAFGAAPAGATTISPPGPFTGTSGTVTIRFWGFVPLTCATSTITGTVNAPVQGVTTITGGKPTFSNCNDPAVLGPLEVTALKPVSYEMTRTASGVRTTISDIDVDLYWSRTKCRIDIQGSAAAENPGLGPVTISELSPSASGTTPPYSMWATVYPGNSGVPCGQWVRTGQAVGIQATYKLDHPLVATN